MEPPASNDLVKEARAPLADIDSEEEVCHPVQQPQAHSVPHSLPPTGTAGIGPASHREEPMNEGSREEVEEEMGHKVKNKHGESGKDSDECMDMKYGMESEGECDKNVFLSSIHTCYHSSFFLLRTPVTVGGKPMEIQLHNGSPTLTCHHSEQECRVSLSVMSHKVAAVLLKHGVYHVDTFYYEQVPLFSVVFSSKASLKRFLTVASGRVKRELESAIGEEFTKQLTSLSDDTSSNSRPSHFDVSINIESYLVTPDRQEGTADVQLVTLANYSHYSSEWQNSRMFEFAHIFQAQLQRGIQKSLSSQEVDCAELKDLVNDLQNVTEWFRLGVNLDIPDAKLMQIHHDYKHIAECLDHMLIEWGKRERRTWSKVVRALAAIGRTLLAQELATKYGVDVPVEETALLSVATESSDSDHQTMRVPTVQTVDLQIEKQLKNKEEQLEASNASRGVIKQDISETTESLQQFQIQLHSVMKDREDIKVQLEQKKKKCEDFHRMQERYQKMWRKSREDIELLDEVIKEKEQEVKKLEGELEQKESEFQDLKQKLSKVEENLSRKNSELQKKTDQVVGLEKEVEQLKVELSSKGKELDMEMQQMTAKASSQAAYIGEMKLHISSMREELLTKEKEFDDYKGKMTEKEEAIKQLTEVVCSQKENQLRATDGAHSTADTVQNPDELAGIVIYVSKLTAELDDANREKHQMMLKSEIAFQEFKRLKESIRKLKSKIPDPSRCRAVGAGLESAKKHQSSEFKVEVADVDGEPCTSNDGISTTVAVTSIADELIITGKVVCETPAVYRVSYQPIKCGVHKISIKVNGMPINCSPFVILVHNNPHPKKCKAIEQGESAQKNNPARFIVQLADEDGDPCVTIQEVTAELKSLIHGSIINAAIVRQTPAAYEVAYQPSKSGEHELIVKVNDMEINGSPFALLVHNIPDPQNCKAVGEGITKAEKQKTSEFMVQLADTEGDPCVTKQEVVVELESLVDGSITKANVVSKSPATYAVSYQPSKSGEHELSVKVNDIHIEGSPFALLAVNIPHTENCKAIGEHVRNAEKSETAKFIVQLADADGEPCVTKQEVTVELKAVVGGSGTKANVVSKTPATYEVSYQPINSGEHELRVKVNGMEINGSPYVLLVHNIPQPQNCKAFGKGIKEAENKEEARFTVQLADAEGDHCVTEQEVVVELKSLVDGSITKANVVCQTPATYEVAYQPSKSGEHELSVKVNGMELSGSPFALLVHNTPDSKNCKAVGEGITRAEKHNTSEFMVQLADAEGDPCVTEQEVVVELKSLVDGSITKANVVSKSPATYAVSYQPSKSGEHEHSVKVNDIHIEGSPFALLVVNIPHAKNCQARGQNNVEKNKTAKVYVDLADADGEPCDTEQEVTVELKSCVNGSITEGSVVSKTLDTYEVSYQPRRSGRHELSVKVNGIPIKGSPFEVFVYKNAYPQNCRAFRIVKSAQKNEAFRFSVQLADEEGDPCVTEQEVTAELKSLADDSITKATVVSKSPAISTYAVSYRPSKSGEHELSVKVNGMEINGSPFVALACNIPYRQNFKVVLVGNCKGITKAEKHKTSKFMVILTDLEDDPCVTEQEVVVELKSLVDGSITKADVVSYTPATYAVSYRPSKSGEHELSVKVNDSHIEGSPFALLVVNTPHTENCKALGEYVRNVEKNKVARFMVQQADEDGEPCATKQEVTVELKALVNGSITEGSVVSRTPATYEASYQPRRSGRHELSVKVNGMPIKGSPFAIFVHNKPHPKKCKAIGEQIECAQKNNPAKFIVQLADEDGDSCVTIQEVTAELKSLMDGSIINATIVSQTPATYEVAYQPSKSGEHEVIVKVNGMEINASPFALLVYNIPDPQNCKAVGEGITKAEKLKTSEFMVKLADAEGDPCVTEQEVVVELKSLVNGSITKANVVRKTPATYAVFYQLWRSGAHELIVRVNGVHINGSPFSLRLYEGLMFNVEFPDESCVTRQMATVQLKSLVDGSITHTYVDSKTPATYALLCQPSKSGVHELGVKVNVNVMYMNGPFAILVYNTNCEVVNEYEAFHVSATVKLADPKGVLYDARQDFTAQLIYTNDYQFRYKLIVEVNGMEINSSPFDLLVCHNCEVKFARSWPYISGLINAVTGHLQFFEQQRTHHSIIVEPLYCKAVGKGLTRAEKHKTSEFIVQLADTEGDHCVTKQEVVVELKSLVDGSIVKANVVSKSPTTYAVSYQPSKSGEHELTVKVNGMHIHYSPFALLVYNIPDPQNCTVIGIVKRAKKRKTFKFNVELADAEGEPCVIRCDVTAQLISADDYSYHYNFSANVTHVSKNIYKVSYRPRKSAEYKLIVKVNGMEINSSPFDLLVYNIPRPRNCNVKIVSYVLPAVAPGIVKVFDSRQMYPPPQQPRTHHSIIVELADKDGEPCITTQKVAATMADKHSLHRCEVHSEDPATYRVDKPNCPIGRYILTAYVNGMAIGNPLRINLGDLNWH